MEQSKTEGMLYDLVYSKEDPLEHLKLKQLIGQGTFGSVYEAVVISTGEMVAVKIMSIGRTSIETLRKEILVMKEFVSRYTIKFHGSYLKEGELWLVMEYCDGGSVSDIMKSTRKGLNENQISGILRQVLKGLDYMHKSKKIHRDIKAGNILLNSQGHAKLADFGVCAELASTISKQTTRAGSPFWMSPEVIKKSEYNSKTDIWSLGITAIEMAEEHPPYYHIHPIRAMFAIESKPATGLTDPSQWSTEFNSFVTMCLKIDPKCRPTAAELLAHPFILRNKGRQIVANLVSESMFALELARKQLDNNHLILPQEELKENTEDPYGSIESSGTRVVKEGKEESKDSGFMFYIKNMDLESDSSNYLKQHFDNKKDLVDYSKVQRGIPAEYRGYSQGRLEQILTRLKSDMETEIELIRMRYNTKINKLQDAINILKETSVSSEIANEEQKVDIDEFSGIELVKKSSSSSLKETHEGTLPMSYNKLAIKQMERTKR